MGFQCHGGPPCLVELSRSISVKMVGCKGAGGRSLPTNVEIEECEGAGGRFSPTGIEIEGHEVQEEDPSHWCYESPLGYSFFYPLASAIQGTIKSVGNFLIYMSDQKVYENISKLGSGCANNISVLSQYSSGCAFTCLFIKFNL